MQYQYIIALDLDGTLLNSKKEISECTRNALEKAYHMGAAIVPATGRIQSATSYITKILPFLDYMITINGGAVFNLKTNNKILQDEISYSDAIQLFKELDTMPVIYDCFQSDLGWSKKEFFPLLDSYIPESFAREMVASTRSFIPNFLLEMNQRKKSVQKIQAFFKNTESRNSYLLEARKKFPDLQIAYALSTNMEFNSKTATKGNALASLSRYLNVPPDNVFAFGDSENDISMYHVAKMSFSMANGTANSKEQAHFITSSNDEDGIAEALNQFLF